MPRSFALLALPLCFALLRPHAGHAEPFIAGVNVTSFGGDHFATPDSDRTLARLRDDHAGMVALFAGQTVDPATDTVPPPHALPTPGGPPGPNANMARAVAAARRLGLGTAIKIAISDRTGKNMEALSYAPHDWPRFWAGYRALVLEYARFAAAQHVDLLFLGTELGARITGPAHRDDWLALVRDVRAVFRGKLSYAATAMPLEQRCYASFDACWWGPNNDEAHWLSFWGALDYAGINAYPGFTDADPATLDREMARQAARWHDEIAATGKPALISEIGTASMLGAEHDTGAWNGPDAVPDPGVQAALYQAMLGYWVSHAAADNVAGVFLWQVNAYDFDGHGDPAGFTFLNKPAEAVVKRLFAPRAPGG